MTGDVRGRRRRRFGSWVAIGMLVAAALGGCAGDSSSQVAGVVGDACRERYGCVELGAGDTIELGALLWLGAESGELGADATRGIELAIDYLDGAFDGVPGELLGHEVLLTLVDEGCDRDQGRLGARRLVRHPNLMAVVGTSCSVAALNAADQIFSDRGIVLLSPSNTSPTLTKPLVHERFYARVRVERQDPGFGRRRVRRAQPWCDASRHDQRPESVHGRSRQHLPRSFQRRRKNRVSGQDRVTRLDLGAVVDQVASSNAEVVYFPFIGTMCSDIARALRNDPRTLAMTLVMSDGCLSSAVLGRGPRAAERLRHRQRPESAARGPVLRRWLPPRVRTRTYGVDPKTPWHATGFDAANVIFDAIRRSAVIGADSTLTVGRARLRRAILEIDGYKGLSGSAHVHVCG